MDTPYTIRAQELRDIYSTLSMKYLTQDERLDVLLTLKHTVKEHDCKLTQEIIELIDREADLLMRGVKESNLEGKEKNSLRYQILVWWKKGLWLWSCQTCSFCILKVISQNWTHSAVVFPGLRKRILTLFLQYCKTPLFNPEAARLIKVYIISPNLFFFVYISYRQFWSAFKIKSESQQTQNKILSFVFYSALFVYDLCLLTHWFPCVILQVPQDPTVLRKNIYFCPSCNAYLPSTEFQLSSNSR